MLSVLANRTYRHLFAAQVIALIGTGMMTVALGLLAFKIAGDKAGAVLGTALAIKMIAYWRLRLRPHAAPSVARLELHVPGQSSEFQRQTISSAVDLRPQNLEIPHILAPKAPPPPAIARRGRRAL